MDDPVALCAEVAAAWHASWLTALGLGSARDDHVWRALDPPPRIYFAAITLRPDVRAEAVADVPGSICDAWQALDLAPHGFRVRRTEPWFYRSPGALPDASPPPELEVVAVSTPEEVQEFEAASVRGFESEGASIAAGTYHPPAVLEDDAMYMFIGRLEGRAVAVATGYRTDAVVGLFGVATVASARGRGYGTAVTRAAMLPEAGLPAILAPSPAGESLYRRLGFDTVGALSIWSRAGPVP